MADFDITKDRFDAVDFMEPFEENGYTFVVKIPAEDNFTIYLRVFQVSWVLRKRLRS